MPAETKLKGPTAAQRLLVQAVRRDGGVSDVTRQAKLSTSSPKFLLGTGLRVVEASPRDCIWRFGLSAQNERAQHPDT